MTHKKSQEEFGSEYQKLLGRSGGMKIYKIGRFYYKQIPEKKYCELFEDKNTDICSLIDYDGEAIKYFIKLNQSPKSEGEEK